jgi:hypothetical protein
MDQVVRLGVDLAKRVLQLHGIGQREQVVRAGRANLNTLQSG